MDVLTDNSFVTSSEIEMSPDEAYMDLDLKDKLNATEVEKIHTLHEGVECKTISVYNFAESQELIRLYKCLAKYISNTPC